MRLPELGRPKSYKEQSRFVVVSVFLPSPGRHRFGTARQVFTTSFENGMFFLQNWKNANFNNRTGIWTLGASGDAPWRAKLCGPSGVFWICFVVFESFVKKTCFAILANLLQVRWIGGPSKR